MSQLAFVCGVPRSGTTAMTQILNAHPKVCLGMERYIRKVARREPITPELFERERFFDFDCENGGTRDRTLYVRLADKWADARVVGDKVPGLFGALDSLWLNCRGAKVVYMLRDVHGVANSWNARALNPEDSWPKRNNYRKAVGAWIKANRIIAKLDPNSNLLIVSYERFFSGNEQELDRLAKFLGIDLDPALLSAFQAKSEQYNSIIRNKVPIVFPMQSAYVDTRTKWTYVDGRLQKRRLLSRALGIIRDLSGAIAGLSHTPCRGAKG